MQPEATVLEATISARTSVPVKEALERLAGIEKRSLANYVRLVLEEHVERTGAVERKSRSRERAA